MQEYAITLYTLVNQSLKFDATDALEQLQIARVAAAGKRDVEKLSAAYKRASTDFVEDLILNDSKAAGAEGRARLQQLIGGK